MLRRIVVAVALVATLSGCSLFRRGEGSRPKTAVLGERIPVLAGETDVKVDPSLAAATVTVPAAEVNAAWEQSGGNAAKAFGNPALAANVTRAWTAKIAGSTPRQRYAASPIIADGKVFVMDSHAAIHAFTLATGQRLWDVETGDGGKNRSSLFGGGVSYDSGRLYATNGLGDAIALEAATGKQVWKKRPGGPLRGAPTVGDGNVYVVTQDNQLFALNSTDGETGWTASATLTTSGVFGVAAPAVARGTVVAGFSSGELTALRYENGRIVWQDQLSRTSISTSVASISDIDASPVIDEGRVYAIGQGGRMVAMDLVGGQRIWELGIAGIDTPWLAGDWLFVVTDEAKVICIQRTTGKIRWITQLRRWNNAKTRNAPIQWSGPVLAGGRLLVTNDRGQLVTLAIADGAVGSTIRAGKSFGRAPVVADNTMVLLDEKGTLSAWR